MPARHYVSEDGGKGQLITHKKLPPKKKNNKGGGSGNPPPPLPTHSASTTHSLLNTVGPSLVPDLKDKLPTKKPRAGKGQVEETLLDLSDPEVKRIHDMLQKMPELVAAAVKISKSYKEAFDYLLAHGINTLSEEQIHQIVEPYLKEMWRLKYWKPAPTHLEMVDAYLEGSGILPNTRLPNPRAVLDRFWKKWEKEQAALAQRRKDEAMSDHLRDEREFRDQQEKERRQAQDNLRISEVSKLHNMTGGFDRNWLDMDLPELQQTHNAIATQQQIDHVSKVSKLHNMTGGFDRNWLDMDDHGLNQEIERQEQIVQDRGKDHDDAKGRWLHHKGELALRDRRNKLVDKLTTLNNGQVDPKWQDMPVSALQKLVDAHDAASKKSVGWVGASPNLNTGISFGWGPNGPYVNVPPTVVTVAEAGVRQGAATVVSTVGDAISTAGYTYQNIFDNAGIIARLAKQDPQMTIQALREYQTKNPDFIGFFAGAIANNMEQNLTTGNAAAAASIGILTNEANFNTSGMPPETPQTGQGLGVVAALLTGLVFVQVGVSAWNNYRDAINPSSKPVPVGGHTSPFTMVPTLPSSTSFPLPQSNNPQLGGFPLYKPQLPWFTTFPTDNLRTNSVESFPLPQNRSIEIESFPWQTHQNPLILALTWQYGAPRIGYRDPGIYIIQDGPLQQYLGLESPIPYIGSATPGTGLRERLLTWQGVRFYNGDWNAVRYLVLSPNERVGTTDLYSVVKMVEKIHLLQYGAWQPGAKDKLANYWKPIEGGGYKELPVLKGGANPWQLSDPEKLAQFLKFIEDNPLKLPKEFLDLPPGTPLNK